MLRTLASPSRTAGCGASRHGHCERARSAASSESPSHRDSASEGERTSTPCRFASCTSDCGE